MADPARLDPRFSLSSVLTMLTIVAAAAASWAGVSAATGRLEQRVADLEQSVNAKLTELGKRLERGDADHDALIGLGPLVKRLAEKDGRP
jgi:hypothetical protein